jgi:hypothetical protein
VGDDAEGDEEGEEPPLLQAVRVGEEVRKESVEGERKRTNEATQERLLTTSERRVMQMRLKTLMTVLGTESKLA